MTLDSSFLAKVRNLPPDKQEEVLDLVEFLRQRAESPKKKVRLKGIFADAGIRITEQEIDEARREMWGSFPRDEI